MITEELGKTIAGAQDEIRSLREKLDKLSKSSTGIIHLFISKIRVYRMII